MAIKVKTSKVKKKILPHISGNVEQYAAVGPSSKGNYSKYDKILYSKLILAWKTNSERNFPSPFIRPEKSIVAVELFPFMCFKYSAWKDTAAINSICNSKWMISFNKQNEKQIKQNFFQKICPNIRIDLFLALMKRVKYFLQDVPCHNTVTLAMSDIFSGISFFHGCHEVHRMNMK